MKKQLSEKIRGKRRDIAYFLCTSVFLVLIYTIQLALFVVQQGSVVQGRTTEGLTPATALRPYSTGRGKTCKMDAPLYNELNIFRI